MELNRCHIGIWCEWWMFISCPAYLGTHIIVEDATIDMKISKFGILRFLLELTTLWVKISKFGILRLYLIWNGFPTKFWSVCKTVFNGLRNVSIAIESWQVTVHDRVGSKLITRVGIKKIFYSPNLRNLIPSVYQCFIKCIYWICNSNGHRQRYANGECMLHPSNMRLCWISWIYMHNLFASNV